MWVYSSFSASIAELNKYGVMHKIFSLKQEATREGFFGVNSAKKTSRQENELYNSLKYITMWYNKRFTSLLPGHWASINP